MSRLLPRQKTKQYLFEQKPPCSQIVSTLLRSSSKCFNNSQTHDLQPWQRQILTTKWNILDGMLRYLRRNKQFWSQRHVQPIIVQIVENCGESLPRYAKTFLNTNKESQMGFFVMHKCQMWKISDNALTNSAESKELTNTIQEIKLLTE